MEIEKVKKLEYLHQLISHKATGTPENCAQKLNICERTLYRYIDYLKDRGAPISYNYLAQSYVYNDEWVFSLF
jgi:predicted DNA-binding transcriptional regulator YafY